LAAALSIASAASTVGQDTQEAEVVYCQSVVGLSASVEALSALDANSTVDELEAAVAGVREAATTYGQSLRTVLDAQLATLETAVGELEAYRDSLEGDETIEEAVQGAAASVASVRAARAGVGVVPDCEEVTGMEGSSPSPAAG
jgi:uncharacterized protein YicC (UPF0701 family)